jgi:hypothetical protein
MSIFGEVGEVFDEHWRAQKPDLDTAIP